MEKDGLIENIRGALRERRNARTHVRTDDIDRLLMKDFDAIADTKDIGLAFHVFGVVLQDTKKHYINDKYMKASIDTALDEWKGATKTLPKVHSPEIYRSTDDDHSVQKKRVDKDKIERGRANDQVRVFLTAQKARTQNECKGKSGDGYKAFLNAQIRCLSMMEKEYQKLQDKAMVIVPEVKKSHAHGLKPFNKRQSRKDSQKIFSCMLSDKR